MEIELRNLNVKTESTSVAKKMRLSDDAASMVFQMFTDNIYSDPIGTVVREITSNCFDSHAELAKQIKAPVDTPVIIKEYHDKVTNNWYISFIDSGVGMSPDRVENIYGVYFESTKRGSNDEIGGFGIGGKTPLAYNKDGFFVITRYEGIEYTYNIVAGEEAPEIHLFSQSSTTEPNGTEVKIPLKSEWDRNKFAEAINKQLHYFENIYFEGFEDFYAVQNDYKIYKGKNFLYRESTNGKKYSNYMHVCLGKVAYPIDFDILGLSSSEHALPIALQFGIGELKPTASRETLDYKVNEDNGYNPIKIITDKIEAAKQELAEMLAKQNNNVQDIVSYYNAKANLFMINLTNGVTINVANIIKQKDIKFPKFPYNEMSIPTENELISKFFHIRRIGKKEGRRDKTFSGNWFETASKYNIYHVKGEFKRKVLKQSYLNSLSIRTYLLEPYNIDSETVLEDYRKAFNLTVITDDININTQLPIWTDKIPKKKAYGLIKKLYNEVCKYVFDNTIDYDTLVVSEDFIAARKKEKLSGEILNTTIPVSTTFYSSRSNDRISLKQLQDVKGKIFYGNGDDFNLLNRAHDLFITAFGRTHLISVNWGEIVYNSYTMGTGKRKYKNGVMFITVSKANEKYLKMLDNTYHVNMFYPLMFHRKMKHVAKGKLAADYINKWNNDYVVSEIFKNKGFKHVSPEIYNHVEAVRTDIKELEKYSDYGSLKLHTPIITKYVDVDKLLTNDVKMDSQESFDYLIEITKKNSGKLRWINLPYHEINPDKDNHNELIQILQVLVDA